jgi:phenylalanyl-tRNA synthetase alpha subunit
LELQRENSRLHEDKINLKNALRTTLGQKKDVEKLNASLKKALSREQSCSCAQEMQELKSALERALKTHEKQLELLALAEREVEELKQALAASRENEQLARCETDVQQEIADDLRRKCAQLRRQVEIASSNSY